MRHRQTKETVTDRLHLRNTAPVLDPTTIGCLEIGAQAKSELEGALYHVIVREITDVIFRDESDRVGGAKGDRLRFDWAEVSL